MSRLIRADLLKLYRRTGMMSVVAFIVLGSVVIYFGADLVLDSSSDFQTATGVLTLVAAVAGAIIGATAGGADIEAGVFRDLAATGRSRTALVFSRVPAAWILTLGMLLIAVVVSALLSSPSLGDVWRGGLSVLVSGALTGSRGPVMGIALAFQLGVAPLLAQLDVLGNARWAIPSVAISRLDSADGMLAALPLAGAIAIILAWAAAGLGGGLWKTRTQEI